MRKRAILATMLIGASTPSYAFYQDMRCERNVATGAMELEPQTSYVAKAWDSYRIIGGQDLGLEEQPVPVPNRPGWVFGMCVVEGHWSRSPEPAPFRFNR
jgi:hypothetical protein